MKPDVLLRLIAVLLAVTLAQAWFVPRNALASISTGHPSVLLVGVLDLLWWCAGVGAVVGLLLVKPAVRWLLVGFFVVGLAGSWVAWIPYAGGMAGWFDSAAGKFMALQFPNFLVLTLVY